jgi:hypothetical protein
MVRANLLFVFFLASTPAFSNCGLPQAPGCATRSESFTNQTEMQECRIQMEAYRREAENYASCRQLELLNGITGLTTEVKDDLNSVEFEFIQAIDGFNRRADLQK